MANGAQPQETSIPTGDTEVAGCTFNPPQIASKAVNFYKKEYLCG